MGGILSYNLFASFGRDPLLHSVTIFVSHVILCLYKFYARCSLLWQICNVLRCCKKFRGKIQQGMERWYFTFLLQGIKAACSACTTKCVYTNYQALKWLARSSNCWLHLAKVMASSRITLNLSQFGMFFHDNFKLLPIKDAFKDPINELLPNNVWNTKTNSYS